MSGIVPGLTMRNDEGECGIGALVPFAGRLWVVRGATSEASAPRRLLRFALPAFALITAVLALVGYESVRLREFRTELRHADH